MLVLRVQAAQAQWCPPSPRRPAALQGPATALPGPSHQLWTCWRSLRRAWLCRRTPSSPGLAWVNQHRRKEVRVAGLLPKLLSSIEWPWSPWGTAGHWGGPSTDTEHGREGGLARQEILGSQPQPCEFVHVTRVRGCLPECLHGLCVRVSVCLSLGAEVGTGCVCLCGGTRVRR